MGDAIPTDACRPRGHYKAVFHESWKGKAPETTDLEQSQFLVSSALAPSQTIRVVWEIIEDI